MFGSDLAGALEQYSYYRRQSKLWMFISLALMLPCWGAFKVRENMLADADFLGGKAEIEHFMTINCGCLILAIAILGAEIFLFFKFCVGKENSGVKILAFIMGAVVSVVSVVIFSFSVKNIASDLRSTTKAELDEYVLSTSKGEYFLGFADGGEYAQMPIPPDMYKELSEGKERPEGTHSVIYDMVKDGGYENVTDYKNEITVEYYFHCAMIEKAKLKS